MKAFGMPRGFRDLYNIPGQPADPASAMADLMENAFQRPGPFTLCGKTIELKRGQWAGSISFFCKRWNWERSKVRRFFNRAQTNHWLEVVSDPGFQVITICNYSEIQDRFSVAEPPSNVIAEPDPNQTRTQSEESYYNYVEEISEVGDMGGLGGREDKPPVSGTVPVPEQIELADAVVASGGRDFRHPTEPYGPPAPPAPEVLSELLEAEPLDAADSPFGDPEPLAATEPEGELALNLPEVVKPKRRRKPPLPSRDQVRPHFERFFAAYPVQHEPTETLDCYRRAIRDGATHDGLLQKAMQVRAFHHAKGSDPDFITHAKNWLRKGSWQDSVIVPAPQTGETNHGQAYRPAAGYPRSGSAGGPRGANAGPTVFARRLARLRNAQADLL